jgi:hypothetical protein
MHNEQCHFITQLQTQIAVCLRSKMLNGRTILKYLKVSWSILILSHHQDGQSSKRDSNPGPPTYEESVLTIL